MEEDVLSQSETDDWESYTSKVFTINYPTDVTISELDGDLLTLKKSSPIDPKIGEFINGISLNIRVHNSLDMSSLEFAQQQIGESTRDNGTGELLSGPEEIVFNGYNAVAYTMRGQNIFSRIIFKSPTNNTLIEITDLSLDPENKGYHEIVNKILSTFEFASIEKSSPASLDLGGFTIIVPDGLKIIKNSYEEYQYPAASLETITPSTISIKIVPNPDNPCLDLEKEKKSSVLVDGVQVERTDYPVLVDEYLGCGTPGKSKWVTFLDIPVKIDRTNRVYFILSYGDQDRFMAEKYLDQILSTFQFTN